MLKVLCNFINVCKVLRNFCVCIKAVDYIEIFCIFRPFIKVTMTIGLARGGLNRSQDEIVRIADEGLYYGKEHGRNQIVLLDMPEEEDDDDDDDYEEEKPKKKPKKKK